MGGHDASGIGNISIISETPRPGQTVAALPWMPEENGDVSIFKKNALF
jgi:hypothetical protein